MKEQVKLTIGIGLMAFGAVILAVSIAVSVVQNLNKSKAIKEFEARKSQGNTAAESLFEPRDDVDSDASESGEGMAKLDDASNNSKEASSKPVSITDCLVRIPKINCTEPVKEGVDRNALAASLGHEPETALPGEVGNCVIAGHRNYTFGKYFNRLNEVEIGDTIYIDTLDDTYEYTVEEIKVVEPTDLSVLDNTEDETLTLYTCTPIYIATHRLVIIAKRVQKNSEAKCFGVFFFK